MQPSLFSFQPTIPTWSVAELTAYIKGLIEGDETLEALWVRGEVSNFKIAASGHAYFTLKDGRAQLQCVMWKTQVRLQRREFLPRDGQQVEARGAIRVYEAGGRYQLYVEMMRPAGEGELYRDFLRLKARLEAEGLFAEERKRPLPRYPRVIGVVTSAHGAALRDILNTLRRRFPLVRVVLAPTLVQGDDAPPQIAAAIRALNERVQPDVILVARGGGSLEDLWAFNSEDVARAIADSAAPVISGVGHQTDFTLADFAADRRAPTPTAAAELAVPDRTDLLANLASLEVRLRRGIEARLEGWRRELVAYELTLKRHEPMARVFSQAQLLDEIARRLENAVRHRLALERSRVDGLAARLEALNPQAILARGYAVVTTASGELVRKPEQAPPGTLLHIKLAEGEVDAETISSVQAERDEK